LTRPLISATLTICGAPQTIMTTTIRTLQNQMSSGALSAVEATRDFLARIARHDGAINSIIEINPDAHNIAQRLDEERARGTVRGALHGVPILIKDNIDTADKMQTTAGSTALLNAPRPADAFIIAQLRAAGAVLLGKTNLSEWANMRGRRSISGWSSRGGQTRNPHDQARSPSGSSSGSAAAMAAGFCAGAIGTETDGSITSPATACGIVGIKPTLGLLSRSGIIPIAHSQDTPGPMTATVEDAALLLGALAAVDRRDAATRVSAGHAVVDYGVFLDRAALRGARIGVLRALAGNDPRVLAIFDAQIALLRKAGATVIDKVSMPSVAQVGKTEYTVLLCEYKDALNRYLRKRGGRVRSLAALIAFNEQYADTVLVHFGQEELIAAQATGGLRDKAYAKALARNLRLTRAQGIDRVLKKHQLDALIVPTGGPAWMIDPVNGDVYNWTMDSTTPAAVAGYPHITVPMGFVKHLPVGLSFIGAAWSEPRLIALAYAYEQLSQALRPPKLLNA
jgi:amidase